MGQRGDNVHLRKDGRWEARYIKGRAPNGRAVYGYCYGASREEALHKAKAQPGTAGRTVGQILNDWLADQSGRLKASTLVSYRAAAEKYILPRLGDIRPEALDAAATERFLCELAEKDGLSPSRVRVILLVLRRALACAGCNVPEVRSAPVSAPRREPRVLTEGEYLRLTAYLQLGMDPCKFGVLLALSTGLRVGELCALQWQDVSPRAGQLSVRATMLRLPQEGGGTKVVTGAPKSAASVRTIPLTAKMAALCGAMTPGDAEAYVLTGTRQFMEPRAVQRRLARYVRDCGLCGVTFQTLRDTFAARCAEAGMDAGNFCQIMGFSGAQPIPPALLHASAAPNRARVQLLEEAGL